MINAPIALAFAAGLVATVNPCGFAMLPAYVGYFLGRSDYSTADGGVAAVQRALVVGAIVSTGFLVVFTLVGLVVTLGLGWIVDWMPWAAMVTGIGVALLGAAMLAGHEPTIGLPGVSRTGSGRGHRPMFVFGVSYAIASLSCTLPVFLAVVAGAIPQTTVLGGVVVFAVYGLGMSLVLITLTLAMALGRRGIVSWLRRSTAAVTRVSGAILVVAGAYIVWFWATNLSNPLAATGPVTLVETWSSRLTELIGDRPALWGGVLATVTAGALGWVLTDGRRTGH